MRNQTLHSGNRAARNSAFIRCKRSVPDANPICEAGQIRDAQTTHSSKPLWTYAATGLTLRNEVGNRQVVGRDALFHLGQRHHANAWPSAAPDLLAHTGDPPCGYPCSPVREAVQVRVTVQHNSTRAQSARAWGNRCCVPRHAIDMLVSPVSLYGSGAWDPAQRPP